MVGDSAFTVNAEITITDDKIINNDNKIEILLFKLLITNLLNYVIHYYNTTILACIQADC